MQSLLPITAHKKEILDILKSDIRVLILVGETGCGKTTQIPQFLYSGGFCKSGMIAVTQPRRVAAMTVAKRVSEEMKVELGNEVGYSVRFDSKYTNSTKIKFLTDGMLLREVMIDPSLSKYSVVILDEAHDRTLHTDILFAIVKGILQKSPTLKVVVMSATLQIELFSSYFPQSHVMKVKGRQHPVEMFYTKVVEHDYLDAALITTLQIHFDEGEGDILVFLTGQEEIESMAHLLHTRTQRFPSSKSSLLITPIFAALPPEKQMLAFAPAPKGFRKVILATNIAESSITINGVRYVIDTGCVKTRSFHGSTGIEMLIVTEVSKQQAWQRAGRAGREAPGQCYRLYTEDAFDSFKDAAIPEIKRCNLNTVVLQLKSIGVKDVHSFPFMESPRKSFISKALQRLAWLGALEMSNGEISPLGSKMVQLPLDPIYSLLLIKSGESKCVNEIATILALITVENVFFNPSNKRDVANAARKRFVANEGDHITMLNVFKQFEVMKGDKQWCSDNFINVRAMKLAKNIKKQLLDYCKTLEIEVTSCGDDVEPVLRALVAGCFLQIARLQPAIVKGGRSQYKTIIGGHLASIHPTSSLFERKPLPPYVVYSEIVVTKKSYLRGVTSVDEVYIEELTPSWFKKSAHNASAMMIASEKGETTADNKNKVIVKRGREEETTGHKISKVKYF